MCSCQKACPELINPTLNTEFCTGFIPTFGPSFVHLYGSTRDYNLIDEHSDLNDGLGEGVSYRGRLLIALKTDISDSIDTAPSEVEVQPTQTIHEVIWKKLCNMPIKNWYFDLFLSRQNSNCFECSTDR